MSEHLVLLLLLVGILAGPVLGVLDPDERFGDMLFPFVSLSVAVILFEGSLTLRWKRLRGLGGVVRRMVGIGLLITCAIGAWAAHEFTGLSWELAILFGSLVVVTGPTVIAPMLRVVRPTHAVSEVLRWEGIVYDDLASRLIRGGSIRATRLTEEFDAAGWRTANPDSWPLFAIDPDGEATPFVEGEADAMEEWWNRFESGWRVISLAEREAPATA